MFQIYATFPSSLVLSDRCTSAVFSNFSTQKLNVKCAPDVRSSKEAIQRCYLLNVQKSLTRLNDKLAKDAYTLTHYQVIRPHADRQISLHSSNFASCRDFLEHQVASDLARVSLGCISRETPKITNQPSNQINLGQYRWWRCIEPISRVAVCTVCDESVSSILISSVLEERNCESLKVDVKIIIRIIVRFFFLIQLLIVDSLWWRYNW